MSDLSLTVHVALDACAYNIQIGTSNLRQGASDMAAALDPVSHVIVICDVRVQSYADVVVNGFTEMGVRADLLTVPSGETSKCADAAVKLWSELLALGADRTTGVIAVGGGVVGDLSGFVAASYARGLRFCQVPTTLLAQVDSSVGGKTGINLPGAKNMVGAFWQPCFVLIDTEVLSTLPDREYASGLAEVVKYGVIMDAQLFQQLEQCVDELNERDAATLRKVVARCCQLKADVVVADERELSGRRAILNYGHTFAHALEATTGYGQLLHGEAVAIGMVCASRLAEQLGRVPSEVTDRQVQLLAALRLPTTLPEASHEELWRAMGRDKKVEHGQLRFVLPNRLGNVELVSGVSEDQVFAALKRCH